MNPLPKPAKAGFDLPARGRLREKRRRYPSPSPSPQGGGGHVAVQAAFFPVSASPTSRGKIPATPFSLSSGSPNRG